MVNELQYHQLGIISFVETVSVWLSMENENIHFDDSNLNFRAMTYLISEVFRIIPTKL